MSYSVLLVSPKGSKMQLQGIPTSFSWTPSHRKGINAQEDTGTLKKLCISVALRLETVDNKHHLNSESNTEGRITNQSR